MPSGQAVLQANNWITPFPLKEFPRTGSRQQGVVVAMGTQMQREEAVPFGWVGLGWVCRVDKSSQLLDRLILRVVDAMPVRYILILILPRSPLEIASPWKAC